MSQFDHNNNRQMIAKLVWQDPVSGETHQHVLSEGATVTIGRSSENDIFILDRHVSRQHAVITYRDGVFVINDLGSVNGTFVNDKPIDEPFPLFAGDTIRLFVPTIKFMAADSSDVRKAKETGNLSLPAAGIGKGRLIISTGPQEGQVIPLILNKITIGRATTNATWEIALQDPAVSRPHARMEYQNKVWTLYDLGSVNGTLVNNEFVKGDIGRELRDGDIIIFGKTIVLYRAD
ncbi:MAG: hypothetical protein CUN56_06535 [Phototrophicales bacterium]|nr:MAG: hypothetical protein CUN56_06535 [Phototrophicales bacterium]RMG71952.1 MAG: FHA domain-containing protein [Chloroflexota bacterium]